MESLIVCYAQEYAGAICRYRYLATSGLRGLVASLERNKRVAVLVALDHVNFDGFYAMRDERLRFKVMAQRFPNGRPARYQLRWNRSLVFSYFDCQHIQAEAPRYR